MFKIKTIFVVIILSFICNGVFAQDDDANETKTNQNLKKYLVLRSSPSFTLQFNLNYNQSLLELSGTYNDDYQSEQVMSGETFGADKGFGANLLGKFSLNEKGTWRLTTSASYNRIMSYLFGSKDNVADQGRNSFNAMSFGVGIENNFTPTHRFKIYFGGEMLGSLINGKMHIWVDNRPNSSYEYDATIKNSFRFGYSLFAGSEYLVNDNFGLNLGFKFSHLNLIGKKAAENTTATEIELPDGSTTSPVLYGGSKNFAYLSVMAGVNFYFGIKQKRYKLGM